MEHIRAVVVGATGYVGVEIVRLLMSHPMVRIKYLCATQLGSLSDVFPHINRRCDLLISQFEDVDFSQVDVVFLCLPHNISNKLIANIPEFVRIIDLSADFRIKSLDIYQQWYGEHSAQYLIDSAVYGLSEIYRREIKNARLVACPGCYATSMLIPLIPLVKDNLIKVDNIIVDAKSGVSGAGKVLKQENMFCDVNESIKVYSISHHRHISEVEQELSFFAKKDVLLQFTPHLIPVSRGILSNIYLNLNDKVSIYDINDALLSFYRASDFIFVDNDKAVNTKSVIGTNFCYLGIFPGRRENCIVIVSVIDNLLKGAAGQAVQNFNIMFSLRESLALLQTAIYV
ncbi:N-acetyl-gamma-glutamyl-phosphate reductase [Neoehrlichia mikurensis]|uniref:N-acetyl-gamma-glutamyl-phosphate reductase n=1 Tax=Neoehrlichia mikurensis TaxID=89586 RepID=A0A9Q9BSY2_9RICK|nr:N-acetyl-gamma-glutamyl-phosphate reductase [Neoehrlichia mikurensis]QXK91660.1 N-acetyl-gamma-glutamyl-phosphate reductase [Neoehrlichia mikurensis]QXK92871.1 N-acetyl-gamma-glutamyl-phosphate reductase [Neoehrlichia mikurensis]QXK93351.1 N-acetyl-gamma-glutamyl-phosphate reductase [Neoehrlichia mikurensis]UTO55705.1 N-acetyl-gamma-glutamyl-phosphate reductase [Neoehrlichia mikurensis]UTO56622.1 N-acetyl-gamma-glutamyl-phosphate reductase [Neoehrlichia mikurensis]